MSLLSCVQRGLLALLIGSQLLAPSFVFAQASAQTNSGSSAGSGRAVGSVQAGLNATARTGLLDDYCNRAPFRQCVVQVTGGVINLALSLSGLVLLGYLIYAGFLWMTSGGESDRAQEAMQMIRNAVIGLLILASAFAISSFVLRSLNTATSPETLGPPPGGAGGSTEVPF